MKYIKNHKNKTKSDRINQNKIEQIKILTEKNKKTTTKNLIKNIVK